MPRYRVLKEVAHNIGDSFTSFMNYVDGDYVMGHVLRLARITKRDTLTIDFVTGKGSPPELLAPPIMDVPALYTTRFWDLVERHGSDRSLVQSARLTLHYGINVKRLLGSECPYTCNVSIVDARGKEYSAHFEGAWDPNF